MAPNLRLLKTALANAAQGATPEKLRELCDRDFEECWNRLKAIAGYGENDAVRLQAVTLMLAYSVGKPVETVDMKVTAKPSAPFDVSQLTAEELRAYRLLAQARDRLLNGGMPEPEIIESPDGSYQMRAVLPPLPPLK